MSRASKAEDVFESGIEGRMLFSSARLRSVVRAGDVIFVGVKRSRPFRVSYMSPSSGIVRIRRVGSAGGCYATVPLLSPRLSLSVRRVLRKGRVVYRGGRSLGRLSIIGRFLTGSESDMFR